MTEIVKKKKVESQMSLQKMFKIGLNTMNDTLVDRYDEIVACMVGLIAKQHVLFISEPGTAKSLIAESICDWIDEAKKFTVHCNKDTSRAAVFGPVKISSLKQDKQERNLAGGAADCHVLILEEVFKTGPAVLDMFLMLLNERVYKEGLSQAKAPLRFCLGVGNEWSPEGCEAATSAFFDRFLIRKYVEPVRNTSSLKKLVSIPKNSEEGFERQANHRPKFSVHPDLDDIDNAHKESKDIAISPEEEEAFGKIYKELTTGGIAADGKKRGGVYPGNRRLKMSVPVCQAYAWLMGAKEVRVEHLEILKDVLWIDPQEQPREVAKIVCKIANPLRYQVNGLIVEMQSVLNKGVPGSVEIDDKLKEIKDKLTVIGKDQIVLDALDIVNEEIKQNGYKMQGIRKS